MYVFIYVCFLSPILPPPSSPQGSASPTDNRSTVEHPHSSTNGTAVKRRRKEADENDEDKSDAELVSVVVKPKPRYCYHAAYRPGTA